MGPFVSIIEAGALSIIYLSRRASVSKLVLLNTIGAGGGFLTPSVLESSCITREEESKEVVDCLVSSFLELLDILFPAIFTLLRIPSVVLQLLPLNPCSASRVRARRANSSSFYSSLTSSRFRFSPAIIDWFYCLIFAISTSFFFFSSS